MFVFFVVVRHEADDDRSQLFPQDKKLNLFKDFIL